MTAKAHSVIACNWRPWKRVLQRIDTSDDSQKPGDWITKVFKPLCRAWPYTLFLARRVFSRLPFPQSPSFCPHHFFNSGRMSVSLGLLFDIVLLWNPISFDKCQKGTHSSVKWAEPRANLSLPPPQSSFVVLTNTVCPELVRPWWP